jgi:hypothetical protein
MDQERAELPSIVKMGVLIDQARALAHQYRSLTGKPLGITGEVAEYEAARLLGLQLVPARTLGYDALKGTERIQIKGRLITSNKIGGQRIGAIKLNYEWDSVFLVILNVEFQPLEIWKATREVVATALLVPGSKARNERGALSISKFKQIGFRLWAKT